MIPKDCYDVWCDTESTDNEPTTGTLSVLNIGAGDLKFTFDPAKPAEVERAKQTIADMLKRGYLLLVEIDGTWHRAKGFNPDVCEYIICDLPDDLPAIEPPPKQLAIEGPVQPKRKGRPKGVKASTVRATAVGPTAGG